MLPHAKGAKDASTLQKREGNCEHFSVISNSPCSWVFALKALGHQCRETLLLIFLILRLPAFLTFWPSSIFMISKDASSPYVASFLLLSPYPARVWKVL